jgi:PII-like signaling protein
VNASDTTGPFPTHHAQRLTILFGARDHDHHGSLLVHLIKRARRAKLAGATAFEAYEGYGASGQVHRTHSLSDDAPVTIIIVDRPERIRAFLKDAADLLENVLVTVVDVEVVEL